MGFFVGLVLGFSLVWVKGCYSWVVLVLWLVLSWLVDLNANSLDCVVLVMWGLSMIAPAVLMLLSLVLLKVLYLLMAGFIDLSGFSYLRFVYFGCLLILYDVMIVGF